MRMKCLHAVLAIVLAITGPDLLSSRAYAGDSSVIKRPPVILGETVPAPVADMVPLPVKISVETAPATPAGSTMERIFTSNAAVTVYVTVALYALKWASDRYKLDVERWEGIILHCYNDAEQNGLLKNWAGHEKLAHAMQLFDDRFRSVFGVDPSARDREDARLDFARTAFNDDPAVANAPKPAVTGG